MPQDDRTSGFFDRYSERFNAIYGSRDNVFWNYIDKHFRRSMRLRFEAVLEECAPGDGKTALDVGCGPGHYMVALIRQGLKHVHGLDLAPRMLGIARQLATEAGVIDKCSFETVDFLELDEDTRYDYVILMGFMDYVQDPMPVVQKAMRVASGKVMFSFPVSKGFLAWQRKIRYKSKCPLYLYDEKQLHALFSGIEGWKYSLRDFGRDYFVVLEKTV